MLGLSGTTHRKAFIMTAKKQLFSLMAGMIESIPGGVVRAYMAGQAMIRLLSIKTQQALVHMAMQGMIESIPGGVVRV